jgi:hypothetical protein
MSSEQTTPSAAPLETLKVPATTPAQTDAAKQPQTPAPTPDAKKEDASAPITPIPLSDEVIKTLEDDYNKNGGKFSESAYKVLKDRGIPPTMADDWVAGQQARSELIVAKTHAAVGGEENLNVFMSWATKSMSKEERETFNKSIESASKVKNAPDAVAMVFRTAFEKYRSEYAGALKTLSGTAAGGPIPFASRKEMEAAFASPQYRSSAEFRADVDARMRAGIPKQ